jgi:hypothetical protein
VLRIQVCARSLGLSGSLLTELLREPDEGPLRTTVYGVNELTDFSRRDPVAF